jgi:hypothetical protein
MPPKKMNQALKASLQAEDEAFQSRFQRAELALSTHPTPADLVPEHPADLTAPPPTAIPPQPAPPPIIRDTFTFPQVDYELIASLQQRCLQKATSVNKSELLRAGLHALAQLDDDDLLAQINALTKLKAGRPKYK